MSSCIRRLARASLAAACLLPLTRVLGGQQIDPARMTPAQRDSLGTRILAEVDAKFGPPVRSDYAPAVDSIIRKLLGGVDTPGLRVRWRTVQNDQFNAFAAPGKVMVVYSGLFDAAEGYAKAEFPSDPVRAAQRARAFVAAVVGHELAHITAGHTSDIDRAATAALVRAASAAGGAEASAFSRFTGDDEALKEFRESREREFEADRIGALYALRGGWAIQDAMDLWRAVDGDDRPTSGSLDRSNRLLSWRSSHPAAAQREANLEIYRGRLRMDQTLLDDAVMLIRHNENLDAAAAMLDTVIADFPTLYSAQATRVALDQARWLNTLQPSDLVVRPALAVATERFYQRIRGAAAPGTAEQRAALQAARGRALALVARTNNGSLLSTLAIFDAYAGDTRLATARADTARRLASSPDAAIFTNRGVARYLAGDYRGALADFDTAQRVGGSDHLEAQFNAARTRLALGDSAGARRGFLAYARRDAGPWGAEATRLANALPSGSGASNGSAPVGDFGSVVATSPEFTGARLNMTRDQIVFLLGTPDSTGHKSPRVLRYPARGLTVGLNGEGRVTLLFAKAPFRADVMGVRLGMFDADAVAVLGEPSATVNGSRVWFRGGWGIRLEITNGMVTGIGVGGGLGTR